MECDCGNIMIEKTFFWRTVGYCEYCKKVKYKDINCVHPQNFPVKYIVEGGIIQVKMYCRDCKRINGRALKQSNYNLEGLKIITKEENYEEQKEQWNKQILQVGEYLKSLNIRYWIDEYKEYLEGDEWENVRGVILRRDKFQCQVCFSDANEVHHMCYKHMGWHVKNKFLFELVALCKNCHKNYYHT